MRSAKLKAGNWAIQKVRGPSKSGFISERMVLTKYMEPDGDKTFSHIIGESEVPVVLNGCFWFLPESYPANHVVLDQ